ncbi:SHOCT domain-containing protein [Hippea maritima]|uniref:SHOCT domain-containing protein n=1 Tax=Hippea maritima (strain ATCC 700847 / DSM 10411 / MH2) TaxID=760142 RepID=F2LVD4_HIPMA|nr:SHOCT domain-containing protein [Hippea maritima]AEA33718.1 Protein of unknown function DUF2078, membrane [Hippea maritima DSM 10411]
MHGYGFHGFFWGGYMGILILILIIAAVVFLIKATTNSQNMKHEGRNYYKETMSEDLKERKNALNILRERYAKGEISKEEYEQMKKDIVKD